MLKSAIALTATIITSAASAQSIPVDIHDLCRATGTYAATQVYNRRDGKALADMMNPLGVDNPLSVMALEAWELPIDIEGWDAWDTLAQHANDRWTAICYIAETDHARMTEIAKSRSR